MLNRYNSDIDCEKIFTMTLTRKLDSDMVGVEFSSLMQGYEPDSIMNNQQFSAFHEIGSN